MKHEGVVLKFGTFLVCQFLFFYGSRDIPRSFGRHSSHIRGRMCRIGRSLRLFWDDSWSLKRRMRLRWAVNCKADKLENARTALAYIHRIILQWDNILIVSY